MFKVSEVQNFNSIRKGYEVNTESLAQAKRVARRGQMFQGTVLVIEDSEGQICSRYEWGEWIDTVHGIVAFGSKRALREFGYV